MTNSDASTALTGPFTLTLKSIPNPDFGQRKAPSKPSTVTVSSLEEASHEARKYIEANDLGGGNWAGGAGEIRKGRKVVARVSYNGRVWPPEAWFSGQKPLWG